MIPSKRYFPGSLQERAAWYDNFTTQFALIATALGFSAADVTAVTNDRAAIRFLANTVIALDAYRDAFRQYRIIMTEGDIGAVAPMFPANPAFVPPATAVPAGIFERLDNLVRRIRVAPAYTDEIGAQLGILPSTPNSINRGDLKPIIKVGESFGGYEFSVNVTRLGQPGFKIEMQRFGGDKWETVAFATNNPVEVAIAPTTAGQPERILVRAILVQKNEPVGQPSDPTFVTVNP